MVDLIPSDVELFFKECELAGLVVKRGGARQCWGIAYGTVTERKAMDSWLELSEYGEQHRLFGPYTNKKFDTVEELLDAANEEIQRW